jgi:hypothetical protein
MVQMMMGEKLIKLPGDRAVGMITLTYIISTLVQDKLTNFTFFNLIHFSLCLLCGYNIYTDVSSCKIRLIFNFCMLTLYYVKKKKKFKKIIYNKHKNVKSHYHEYYFLLFILNFAYFLFSVLQHRLWPAYLYFYYTHEK